MNKEEIKTEIKELEARLEKLKAEVNKTEELEPYEWWAEDFYYIDSDGDVESSGGHNISLFTYPKSEAGLKQAKDYAKQLRTNSMILRLKQALGDEREFEYGKSNWHVYRACDSFNIAFTMRFMNIGVIYFSSVENVQKVCDWMNENWDYEKGQRK